jgi:peptide/nickel transport system permease protein
MRKPRRVNLPVLAGGILILLFVVVALLAGSIAPYDPNAMMIPYLAPSPAHLLGTNDLGQDIFSELVYGTRVSLLIGVLTAGIVTFAGAVLALVSGYYGGWADRVISAVTDVAMAVPSLPLTVLLMAYLDPGMWSLILAISLTAWTGTARILRAVVMQLKEQPFVQIERAMGVRDGVILFKHLLPNLKDILLTRGALAVSSAMMTEAGLSFLGLGTYGEKSWGSILHFAFFRNSILRNQFWWYVPPIALITLAVAGFMLVGYYGQKAK